jgi:dCTP deaminase
MEMETNLNAGVLPSQWIKEAIDQGIVTSCIPFGAKQIQPNSLDLRLNNLAYRVNCSFLPGREGVEAKLSKFKWYESPVTEKGLILERNLVYLFPLCERLALPDHISAGANPKSSTGRLDVFTRLVTENGTSFDEVAAGYHGALYLEVVPRSFAIVVRPGDSLAQIRFQVGDPKIGDRETHSILNAEDIILRHDMTPMRSRDLRVSDGVFLSVRLDHKNESSLNKKKDDTVGYRARKNQNPIDLRGKVPRANYWERIYSRGEGKEMILEPDEFYIFASKELVRLPPGFCAEMVPFDAGSGELRTHYAGFFDSGFGYEPGTNSALTAAAVVLEIRNRDVPFLIEENNPLFRLILLRNTEAPQMLYGKSMGSNYQSQRLRLGKQFNTDDAEDPIEQVPLPGLS